MLNLWTLGGLSLKELLRRTALESWKDAVFGQGGRMAFYHFLALFPSLLMFLAISSRMPYFGDHIKNALGELSALVLPSAASRLFIELTSELNERSPSGLQLISVGLGALWAALNASWAMIYGLNRAYEVEEHRSWWKLALTVVGLTATTAVIGSLAILLTLCSEVIEAQFQHPAVVRGLRWLILSALLSLSFAIFYRFGPNLRDHEWGWSTPGALCALILWIAASAGAHIYFDHVNDYARTYGHLNGTVILLLWLYLTSGSILIGGEMNSEIEKAAVDKKAASDGSTHHGDRSGS